MAGIWWTAAPNTLGTLTDTFAHRPRPPLSGPHPGGITGRGRAQALLWTVTWMAPVLTHCRGLRLQTPRPQGGNTCALARQSLTSRLLPEASIGPSQGGQPWAQ